MYKFANIGIFYALVTGEQTEAHMKQLTENMQKSLEPIKLGFFTKTVAV